jgi:hypothetical protein
MNNPLYITLEQDLIQLENRLNSIENLIDVDKFKAYGRYANLYTKHYQHYDKKRSRVIAIKTLKNAMKSLKSINKKVKLIDDFKLINKTLSLLFRLNEIQRLFI